MLNDRQIRHLPVTALTMGLLLVLCSSAAAQNDPIVYSRCARRHADVELSGEVVIGGVAQSVTQTFGAFDIFDVLPDVTNFLDGFSAPCDLMYRDAVGAERVLYSCSDTSTEEAGCAALDAAVSFDGRTVAFSVFRGTLVHPEIRLLSRQLSPDADNPDAPLTWQPLPHQRLNTTEAQLFLVDVETGALTPLPYVEGEIDSGPAFMPDGRLSFTSTRDGHRATLVWVSTHHKRGTRIWAMDLDGRNVDLASHHSLGMEQHPFMLQDGRLAYSSWQAAMGKPFRYTNGSVRGSDTLDNLFHLYTQSPDGANNFALYGQHSGDHNVTHFGASHIASHFMTQTGDGFVWTADYYRGNNNGLGIIAGFQPEPEGQEGINPHDAESYPDSYAPREGMMLAAWASNLDVRSEPMPGAPFMHPNYPDPLPFRGKLGHPAALSSEDHLMVAWGKGPCFRTRDSGVDLAALVTAGGMQTPGCDVGLYRSPIPSEHPSDLEMIVDSTEWHEIMGRAVVPYADIHGIERPVTIERADLQTSRPELETGTPFGLLGAASITDRETHPRDGLHFAGTHQFHGQGTDTIAYEDEELCGVRILGVMPNRGTIRDVYEEMRYNPAGERIGILGEFSVRNRDESGALIIDANGNVDTSFLVRMPANVPYFMQGIDCEGRTLNTDQTWQHLRPGEEKTCGGCHVHSRPALMDFEDSFAAMNSYEIPTIGAGEVPLLTGESGEGVESRTVAGYGLFIDFETDIMPIFERRCTSCHGGDTPDADLALDRPGTATVTDGDPSTWHCLVHDAFQNCIPEARRMETFPSTRGFGRPQLTRYIRAYNSRASLLYWKARGERTDNHTDATFDATSEPRDRDIDFGVAHETDITPDELGLLARWIDIGSAGGMPPHDTQRPTIHLSAILEGESVTELRVGTIDLGDGVDTASLEVCVVGDGDTCTDLSADAHEHGVVAVSLTAALTDPDQEVLARVSDLAGNVTEVRRTVRWLLNTPPPPPPGSDAGPVSDGGISGMDGGVRSDGGMPDGDIDGGCGCRVGAPRTSQGAFSICGLFGLLMLRRRFR
ncbi:MAG: hypothetical protein ACI9KE_003845 [Polyangiales bacterium]|jgi:hypothetical protein